MSWWFSQRRKRALAWLAGLLSIWLIVSPHAAFSQSVFTQPHPNLVTSQVPLPSLPAQEKILPVRPELSEFGDLVVAEVTLDGRSLIRLASDVDIDSIPQGEAHPLVERTERVQKALERVLSTGFDPDKLAVTIGLREQQPYLIASDQKQIRQQLIVTVTDLDADYAGVPVFELAEDWKETIQTGLLTAAAERQPKAIGRKHLQAIAIFLSALAVSFGLTRVQRRLKARKDILRQPLPDPEPVAVPERSTPRRPFMGDFSIITPLQFLTQTLPQITRERQINVNRLLRRLLQWLQVVLWAGSLLWILSLYPGTRAQAIWLANVPIKLLWICLLVSLTDRGTDVLIDFYFKSWAERETLEPSKSQRQALRAPTFAAALKGLTTFAAATVGVFWFLAELGVPLAPVLTLTGILGFAFSFSSQNLIKDMINGCLILWEDQFAVGDVIAVDEVAGLVENMNLRITQLRDVEGQLITIPNGTIAVVRNLSNGWSRVNFAIEVAYEADAERAMEIIGQVAEDLHQDAEWQSSILEQPQLLGIDDLAHTGVMIRLWIKTLPLQQWSVAREFRRRLKLVFDQEQIPIGMPQQALSIYSPSEKAN